MSGSSVSPPPCGTAAHSAVLRGSEEEVLEFLDTIKPLGLEEAFSRIVLGAMLLDRTLPGWRSVLNWDVMNFRCGDHTLLGQVGRNDRRLDLRNRAGFAVPEATYFELTRLALRLSNDEAVELGFALEPQVDDVTYSIGCGFLHAAWRRFLG